MKRRRFASPHAQIEVCSSFQFAPRGGGGGGGDKAASPAAARLDRISHMISELAAASDWGFGLTSEWC